jgi:hypothetical protein
MAAIIAIGVPKEKPSTPTLTLPLDALSSDGEEPTKGDEVEHSFKGTIASIKGDMATIRVTALDGQPVEGSPEEEAGESPEEESGEEEEESSSPSGKSPKSNPGNPGANPFAGMMGMVPPAEARARARARASTAALGAGLRKRARGRPIPLM